MRTFRNHIIDDEFHKYGYVVVNLLDEAHVRELTSTYMRHPPPDNGLGLVASMTIDDPVYRRAVDREIRVVLDAALTDILYEHRLFHASFVAKRPRMRSSVMPLHQDPSLVDEHEHTNFTIWCPLVEMTAKNGWLGVVAGSHRFNRGFRSTGMPYPEFSELLETQLLTNLPVRPGQVIFLHPRTLHGSPINRTYQPRLAAAGTIAPRTCDRFYYCHRLPPERGEHMLEVFEVGEDFFLYHMLGRRPTQARSCSVVSAPPEPLDAQRLLDTCAMLVRENTDSAIVEGFTP